MTRPDGPFRPTPETIASQGKTRDQDVETYSAPDGGSAIFITSPDAELPIMLGGPGGSRRFIIGPGVSEPIRSDVVEQETSQASSKSGIPQS